MVKATKSGSFKAVKLPQPQTTVARCYSLIDIGTVENRYQGVLQGTHHRIVIWWELPKFSAVFNEDKGKQPFSIFEEFTLSTKDNSNFAKLVANWRNKPFTPEEVKSFDPMVLVGKTCVIQFIHKRKTGYKDASIPPDEVTNENTTLRLQAIMKRPNEMEIPPQINPTLKWDWEAIGDGTEKFDVEKWNLIPAFIRSKMETSEEYKKFAPKDLGQQSTADSSDYEEQSAEDAGPVSEDEW